MILGIDQGTTGSTAILLSDRGIVKAKHNTPFKQHYPQAGWVEHDPKDILKSVESSIQAVLKQSKIKAESIKAIGITNQRETVSLFEGNRPLHRFIVWQDRRTSDICNSLASKKLFVLNRNGTPIDPYFSSTKIQWLYKKLKLSKKNKNIRFRTIDSFLLHALTGEDVIECTNAQRTQLTSLKSGRWDKDLFSLFDLPRSSAPEILSSEGLGLKTKAWGPLPAGIPVQACLGDQQAALFGQLGWQAGEGKITFGTGSFLLANVGREPRISKNSLVGTVALEWANGERVYALEGSAFICGAWIQWLRDELQMIDHAKDSEKLASQVKDSNGVFVIPALSGMGAPFWKSQLRGSIQGLTRGANKSHIARASLEALCFQNRALIESIRADVPKLKLNWKVDGGAVENNLLLQIQADALQRTIIRPKNLEATGSGVALLAGKAAKIFTLEDIKQLWKLDRLFKPEKKNKKIYNEGYQRWTNYIRRQ